MNDTILNRAPHRPAKGLTVMPEMSLQPGRVHELCGTARRRLALRVAGAATGPVLWLRPAWRIEAVNPDGLRDLMAPGRLIFATPSRGDEILWAMEEALRSGAAPVVVAEMSELPAMTPVRRLHLAAESGGGALGLILSEGIGGAPGVESRWSLEPTHEPEQHGWRLERLRARTLVPKVWDLVA